MSTGEVEGEGTNCVFVEKEESDCEENRKRRGEGWVL